MHIQFAQPVWLWVGLVACVALAALLARSAGKRRQIIAAFGGAQPLTTVSATRRHLKRALILVSMAAAFVAMARPLAGFRWEETRHEGIDLMFAVDTSKSMGATDLRPDRLTRAKLAVHDLLREFPGERVGLIAFAGDAFVQAPMTIDQAIFAESLDALDTSVIPRGGTDIGSAIRVAREAMASEPDRRKVLVLLSDGEDLQGDALAAAKDAGAHGLVIYTVGVGTPAGELVPSTGPTGQQDLVRDEAGQPVRSRLDERTLTDVARSTGGAYASLGSSGRGLEMLYRQYLAQLPRHTVEERSHKVYIERFQYPLALAIGCLLVELILGERRRARAADRATRLLGVAKPRTQLGVSVSVAAAILAAIVGAPSRASAATAPTAKSGAVATYNGGTEAYRQKDFGKARDQFQSAMHTADVSLQEDAYYDLGNTRYRLGQSTLAHDPQATIETWKSALASYDGALALAPKDADAKFNRDLVARQLAALKQQQQQQQQKQSDSQGKQNQNQQGQGGQSKSQQAQGDQKQGKTGQQGGQGQQNGQKANQDHGPQGQTASQGGQDKAGQQPSPKDQPSPSGAQAQQSPQKDSSAGPQQGQQKTASNSASGPSQERGERSPGASSAGDCAADAKAAPGAMTRAEATQLLDSLHGDLRRMPVATSGANRPSDSDRPMKDW